MASDILQPPPYKTGSLEEQLRVLYKRRSTVENLIHTLEEYGRCHADEIAIGGMRHKEIDKWSGLLVS